MGQVRKKFNEKDYINREFGFLTILRFTRIKFVGKGKQFARYCLCKCRCGGEKEYFLHNILSGMSQSCGCKPNKRNLRHNLSKHPLGVVWYQIMNRCYSPGYKNYSDYGGRGIIVYEEWHDIEEFVRRASEILGEKPKGDYSIDRIDNDRGYYPDNIRWATRKQQQNNQRISGKLTMKVLADATGYTSERIRQLTRRTTSSPSTKKFPLGNFIKYKIGNSFIYNTDAVEFLINRRLGIVE